MEKNLFDLTAPQKSIWLTEQVYKGSNINNICGSLFIKEKVDFNIFEESIRLFVKKNDSFLFKFKIVNNSLLQYKSDYMHFPIEKVFINNTNEINILEEKLVEEVFPIENSLLFKFTIFSLPDGTGGFVVNVHHLISDAATFSLLAREIVEIYSDLINGNTTSDENYPSYFDFIEKEHDYFNGEKFIKDKIFWENTFTHIPDVASIPNVKGTSLVDYDGNCGRANFILSNDIVAQIQELCKQYHFSSYDFFMGVYAIYLSRVCNLTDFVIGTPILNRSNFQQKNTTGMFISTIPIPFSVSSNLSFLDFMKNVAENLSRILRHQRYPYSYLLDYLRKQDFETANLFDFSISYQITKATDVSSVVPYETHWTSPKVISNSINLHLHDNNDTGNLIVSYDYRIPKYSLEEIEDMHNRIIVIIKQILDNPTILISNIEIVTDDEKRLLLNDFNSTFMPYPNDKSIVQLFHDKVKLQPNHIAIVYHENSMTYNELDIASSKVASYLTSLGFKDNDVIGIHLEKDISYIVSVLGVLKIGAIFVPLSTSYPSDRVEYMLKNSGAKCVISTDNLIKNLSYYPTFVDITTDFAYYDFKDISYSSSNLAYILYTSGSTGTPKGVMIKHSSVVNHVYGINERFSNSISSNDICLSIANISFDASLQEIFIALLNGCTLHLLENDAIYNIENLSKYIYTNKVSFCFIPPTILEQVYCLLKSYPSINLNKLLVGVESIKNSTLNKYLSLNDNMQIHNGYGPTEATICCVSYMYNEPHDFDDGVLPIGKPLGNTNVYIVHKESGRLQPIGVPGEIFVTGDCLSTGYFNNSILTKNSFEKSIYTNAIGYHTGDYAKFLPNGNIKFIGRIDSQVKIHGYRIELKEIDSVISSYPNIVKSITLVSPNKQIFSAFISDNNIDISSLKNFIKEKLPQYMVPTRLIKVSSFPITSNGKINTKTLLSTMMKAQTKSFRKPENDTQKEILELYKSVLNISNISIDDDFFELGGDSLLAITLSSLLSKKFMTEITVKDIFNAPNVSSLSKLLSLHSNYKERNMITTTSSKDYYYASSAQKRIYFASTVAGKNSILYNTCFGICFNEKPNLDKLEACFQTLVNHYEVFRTYFDIVDGVLVQKIVDNISFSLEICDKKLHSKEECLDYFIKAFDLSKPPLIRACFYCLTDGSYLLLLDIHHIICDGVSFSRLIDEICLLYNNKQVYTSSLQYKDFSTWEYAELKNGGFDEDRAFWQKQLEGELPVLNMPTSYSRPAIQSFAGKKFSKHVNKETKKSIDDICHNLHITPYLFFLSIYYILLYKYTGQDDILIGSPITGRNHEELSNVIGMFVNTLVLRNKINSQDTFSNFVSKVSSNCINCFEHQEYPFDEIINDLKPSRDSSRNVLFDVMFSYQNSGIPNIDLDNLTTTIYVPESNISKFDLSIEVIPSIDGFDFNFEYCTDLFSDDFMSRFSDHYFNLLECVLKYPNVTIANISLLTKFEKNQLFRGFINHELDYPYEESIISLFEKMAIKYPNSIAISDKNCSYTYSELDKLANFYAYTLQNNGIEKGDVVATLLDRSCSLIISMLAIMKLGAIYLPLSTDLPKERLEYILKDSNAKLYISNEDFELKTYFLSLDVLEISSVCYTNRDVILPNDVLYLIYTSGSTGLPKGVKVCNKNLNNFIHSFNKLYNYKVNENDICLASTNISFDVSIWEFFFTLLNGAHLYLYKEPTIKNIFNYCNCFIDNNITMAYIPPNILEEVYSVLSENKCVSLNKILIGVEPIKSIVIRKFFDLNPDMQIVNGYGPTETTICCTAYTVTRDNVNNYPIIPIGIPLPNLKAFVLDKDKCIVPIGVTGELYISGDNVSLGYLNNDDLTSEKYVKLPFLQDKILYNTGDLVKWDEYGILSFVGRIDHQIKLNGHRIELSEIEKNIYTYPQIDKCIVLLKDFGTNNKKLVCYFTSYEEINLSDLKTFLQRKLPSYFIPNFFKQVKSFRLTNNGKIDRKYLETLKIEVSNNFQPPQNETQKLLANIWSRLLNCENVGIHDNFFELGGDSLIAIKMQIECFNSNLGVSYADIFNYPTIYQLDKKLHEPGKEIKKDLYDYSTINDLLLKNDFNGSHFSSKSIGNILLAGATGFVGVHILAELLDSCSNTIYCLVRSKNNMSPEARLDDTLQFYFGNKYDNVIGSRVIVINGDITKPKFGLSSDDYKFLGSSINCFINSAALVKHYGKSKLFLDTNTQSVKQMIEFCSNFNIPLYHLSTLSISGNVFAETSYKGANVTDSYTFTEKDFYIGQDLSNIYLSSKFTAERMIFESIASRSFKC